MGRKKMQTAENAATSEVAFADSKPNLSQFVRDALDAGILSPSEIVEAIKTKHGVEVKTGLVSMVKNKWKKDKGGKAKAKPGRKPKAASSSNGQEAPKASGGGVSIDDLLVLKGLVAKHGAVGIGRLLEVIS